MQEQNFKNYRRYYAPHHFIFLPAMIFCVGFGIKKSIQSDANQLEWTLFSILSFAILYLAVMLRQHYALGNQDRIVRLEFRLRHLELLNKSSTEAEHKLSFAQIAALRFAGDAEFKLLLNRALTENLNAEGIKKAITIWRADTMRV